MPRQTDHGETFAIAATSRTLQNPPAISYEPSCFISFNSLLFGHNCKSQPDPPRALVFIERIKRGNNHPFYIYKEGG
jgi:hypothetical protein